MAINISDLISEYGAYYNDGSQNEARIRKALYYGNETAAFFKAVPTDSTRYEMATDSITRVAQGFQTDWSPTGDYNAKPRPIDTYRIKADVQLTPDTIEASWLGFLAANDTDRTEWPLIRYIIEGHILPRFNNDIERNEIYHGQYSAASGGTPGDAQTAMEGLRKQINDAYASEIPAANKIPTGALSADPVTFVEQIESFCADMPEILHGRDMNLAIAGKYKSRWLQGMRKKYNMNYQQIGGESEIMKVADHPFVKVMPLASFQNSEKIFASVVENAIMPVKDMASVGKFEVEKVDRTVKIYTDVRFGVGVADWSQTLTNDRDLSAS